MRQRRTQSLRGGLSPGAPLHWRGELATLEDLVTQTFVQRMGGPTLDSGQIGALRTWINSIPVPPLGSPESAASIVRGAALFANARVGCAGCHSGPRFTNNAIADVGTGQSFKVPSLIGLSLRAPYMHNGCAATIADRFTSPCGGYHHGQTDWLSPSMMADLIGYLENL